MSASAILYVDDDQDNCASLSDVLSDLGYRVDMASDGPAALERSRRHPYGLALLDYKMPGMDGLGLYGHLKQVRADTVGVLVTGFAGDATIQEANRAGIRRVLPKRVDFGHLIPLIEEVLGWIGSLDWLLGWLGLPRPPASPGSNG
jgi:CheY-like chemotaxis protein